MNLTPQPKNEFLASEDNIKRHRALVMDESFRDVIQTALLEMSHQICNNCPPDNMGACAAGHLRMLGAHDFVQVFMNLAEKQEAAKRVDTTNLPGNVRKMPGGN